MLVNSLRSDRCRKGGGRSPKELEAGDSDYALNQLQDEISEDIQGAPSNHLRI